MSIFDTPKRRPGGRKSSCPIPGCNRPRQAEVAVLLLDKPHSRERQRQGVKNRSITRSRSYCLEHAEQEFRDLLKTGGFTL